MRSRYNLSLSVNELICKVMSDLDDWEVNDYSEAVVKDSWEDEEEVQESWESIGNSSSKNSGTSANGDEAKAALSTTPVVKKKKTLKQVLAEKEEKERIAREQEASKAQEPVETAEEKRRRELKLVQDSDLENAKDLFGALSVNGHSMNNSGDDQLLTMAPRTRADFDKFAQLLAERALQYQKSPFYPTFCETLVRAICDPLDVIDITKVNSGLTALGNERRREAKAGQKKKKAAAPAGPKMMTKGAKSEFDGFGGDNDTEFMTGGVGSNAGKYDVYDDFM